MAQAGSGSTRALARSIQRVNAGIDKQTRRIGRVLSSCSKWRRRRLTTTGMSAGTATDEQGKEEGQSRDEDPAWLGSQWPARLELLDDKDLAFGSTGSRRGEGGAMDEVVLHLPDAEAGGHPPFLKKCMKWSCSLLKRG